MNLEKLLRENIKNLMPFKSARSEFKGDAMAFLDANENNYGIPVEGGAFNRYPDPYQNDLKLAISEIKGVPARNTFVGNGSDEIIDLLIRSFCEPREDNIIIMPPTFDMYEVSAHINAVEVRKIALTPTQFQLDTEAVLNAVDEHTKIIFICSPNNPTGNDLDRNAIEVILNNFEGLVVVDEAYINYSTQKTFIQELTEYPNLVVVQTLSKAWGLAGLRIGMAFANDFITSVLNKVKPPYNINLASQHLAIKALKNVAQVNQWIKECVQERQKLTKELLQIDAVSYVYPSDSNFILVQFKDVDAVFGYLTEKGIIVRNRSKVAGCEGCLRITVGTAAENMALINALKSFTS